VGNVFQNGNQYFQLFADNGQRATIYREQQTGSPCSPDEEINRDMGRGTMKLWVPWAGRQQAALDFLGYSQPAVWTDGTKYISRINPWNHPDWPGYLYVERLGKIEGGPVPLGQSGTGVAQFDEASIILMFHSPVWGIVADQAMAGLSGGAPDESLLYRNCIIDYQPGGYYQTLPAFGSVVWFQAAASAGYATAHQNVLFANADYTVTWLDVPLAALPLANIVAAIGTCNLNPFGRADAPGGLLNPESAVCLFPKISPPHRMPNGQFAYDVQLRFKVYPQNPKNSDGSPVTSGAYNLGAANALYRYETGQFEPVRIKKAGPVYTKIFPTSDFKLIFQPP
jgi:hypothetical protein